MPRVLIGPQTAEQGFKACCAGIYGSDVVALLLGSSYHPGGRDLTRRLAVSACLEPGERVLDVASGAGESAMVLARGFRVPVRGVDLSVDLVRRANARASEEGWAPAVTFEVGDAERLPVEDDAVDVVLCECALCTFPDKRTAVREFARVLAPGGRLMLADVVAQTEELPAELVSFSSRVACLADALPLDGYLPLLEEAGLRVRTLEHHDDALTTMALEVDERLAGLEAVGVAAGLDVAYARRIATSAVQAVEGGLVGYVLITAALDAPPGVGSA